MGLQEYRKNGLLHRRNGPAWIPDNGDWKFFIEGIEVPSWRVYGELDYEGADHIVQSCPDGSIVCLDSQGRLHNRRGAAQIKSDGTAYWFHEGKRVR